MEDPVSAIENFLVSLPDTIRNEILIFVLIYSFDYKLENPDDLVTALSSELAARDGGRRFGIALRLIGSVDFVLRRYIVTTEKNRSRWPLIEQQAEGNEKLLKHFAEMKLRAPMMERHSRQALAEWECLRSTDLSFQALKQFEDNYYIPGNRER